MYTRYVFKMEMSFKIHLLCIWFYFFCFRAGQSAEIYSDSSIVFLNGVVYTVDTDTNWDENPKEAIVIYNETIKYVGSNDEAKKYIIRGRTHVYELGGAVVLPGFHDVHMHPLETMSPIAGACILPNLTPPDDQKFTDVFNTCKDKTISGTDWVLGAGHSITSLMDYVEKGKSPKLLLDKFINDRPAAMLEETSHSAWVNSKALEIAQITSATPEKAGGVIMREPGSQEPNGILFENAAIEIFALATNSCKGNDELICRLNNDGLFYAMEELMVNGITSICDARVFWKLGHDYSYEDACKNDYLSARSVLALWAYPNADDEEQINSLKKLYSNPPPNDKCSLRKTQIKVYMDGIIQSTTAAMDEEYLVNLSLPHISEKNIGMNYFSKTRLIKYLKELQEFDEGKKGFDFLIHAIGDRGIRDAIDAIKEAKQYLKWERKPRHRITHVEILSKADVPMFANEDIIADFQVAGEFTLPSDHASLAEFIGDDKAKFSIPVNEVQKTGAVVTLSSDWDVSTVNPFVGLQHAAQRDDQSVTIKEAIEMYTVNPAFAMRQEERVGYLSAGMEADLIVINKDILKIDVKDISDTQVLQTVFMGESIYFLKGNANFMRNTTLSWDVSSATTERQYFLQIICYFTVFFIINQIK